MSDDSKNVPSAVTKPRNTFRTGVESKASTYQSKYRQNTYLYPIDLFNDSNQYGDNYVVFYVNVPAESKLLKDNRVKVTERDTTELAGVLRQTGITAAQAVTGATLATGVVGKALGFSAGGSALTGFAGSLLASSQATAGTDNSFMTTPMRQTRRITDSITLNIPNNLVARYSMSYGEEDMAAMTALARAGDDIVKFVKENNNSGSFMDDLKKKAAGSELLAAATGGVLATPGVGGFLSSATGMAANPKKEQIFKGVDFRTFNFEYTFAPRNKQESEKVKEIIKTFKLHMHPEFKDENGYLFLYPSEFEIVYYQGGQENMNLPRHTSCVLVDMSINYTPNGMFNTFEDGSVPVINVSLVFRELSILTKTEILDGF